MARDLRPVYTAPIEAAAEARFAEFPAEHAALKCLYLVTRALDLNRPGFAGGSVLPDSGPVGR